MISGPAHLARLARASFVFAREGVLALIDPRPLPLPARLAVRAGRLIERPSSAAAAGRLSAALTRLGPTYVKLGQFMATRPDVVGVAIARRCRRSFDQSCEAHHASRPRGECGRIDEGEATFAHDDESRPQQSEERSDRHLCRQSFQAEWTAATPPERLRKVTRANPAPSIIAANRGWFGKRRIDSTRYR